MSAQFDGSELRSERDALGEVEVPANRLWGAETQRCLRNFPIGQPRFRWGRNVIRAMGIVKKSAAIANLELGRLSQAKAQWISTAAQEVIDGRWDDEFPLTVFQTGSGTQSNMNANEVIARRSTELALGQAAIHPNDDVNRSQSSNDAFPSVMHIATVEFLEDRLIPAVTALHATFAGKSAEHMDLVMVGRTHMQDAAPITLGQVISGWASQLESATAGIQRCLPDLYELALGATAVGTGMNSPAGFGEAVARQIALETGKPFVTARNKFAAISAHDPMVAASGALRTLAGALMKIANDLRWYACGPRAGIGELSLPANEPGSSIMPGKVNPTQCEALTQVAVQVFGNDHAIAFAGSQGNFQLNVFKPVILHNVLESIELLAEGCSSFDERCAQGFEPNQDTIQRHLESSLMLVTALSPHIGYDKAARIATLAQREGKNLREAAVQSGALTAEQFDEWVRPEKMIGPTDPGAGRE